MKRAERSVFEFLALNRNITLLLLAIILIGSGEEMWMRFVPKYLEALGATPFLIGLFDALKTLLGALYAYPGGVVVDRWGHRRAFVAFTGLSLAGYSAMLLTHRPAGVILAMFLFLAWSNLSLPATFSLVAASLPASKHTMGIGVQSLIKRLPIVIGPVAGGMLMDRLGLVSGVRAGISISILLTGSSIFLQRAIRDTAFTASPARSNVVRVLRSFPTALSRLLWSDILIRFCERLPFAWVVIYALDQKGMTATKVGILIAVEMGAAIACYVPTAYLADRFGKEPFVVVTFVFFTLFPLLLAAAHSFRLLVLAFAVRGLKEFGEPARKSLILSYAPPDHRGQAVGTYYLVRDTVVSLGSFAGAALWNLGPAINFRTAAALGAAGTVVYVLTLRTGATNRL